MQSSLHSSYITIQQRLFPMVEEELGPMTPRLKQFASLAELANPVYFAPLFFLRGGAGRPQKPREWLFRAFLFKIVFGIEKTKNLAEMLRRDASARRLCGWDLPRDVPSESTFSRAFAEFASQGLPAAVHEAIVKAYANESAVGHASMDSTAIHAREKSLREKPSEAGSRGRGRGRKRRAAKRFHGAAQNAALDAEIKSIRAAAGKAARKAAEAAEAAAASAAKAAAKAAGKAVRASKAAKAAAPSAPSAPENKDFSRLAIQPGRALEENLADLPSACDWGCKNNSKGRGEYWRGYKLHLAADDNGVILCAILTSASLNDSQAAIPLMQMSSRRARAYYDLADAAYDAQEIRDFSRSLGRVPIIDTRPRPNGAPHPEALDPAQKLRYNARTAAERANSDLKDNCLGRKTYYRGAQKLFCHLMFGILTITVKQIFNIFERSACAA